MEWIGGFFKNLAGWPFFKPSVAFALSVIGAFLLWLDSDSLTAWFAFGGTVLFAANQYIDTKKGCIISVLLTTTSAMAFNLVMELLENSHYICGAAPRAEQAACVDDQIRTLINENSP